MQITNRAFRRVTIGSALLLVPGLMIAGLLLVDVTKPNTSPRAIGAALIGGSITSAAFFIVGWMVDRNASRRQHSADLVNAVADDLVKLKNAAQLARFYITLNHSAPTYRDRIGPLIAGVGTVEEHERLLSRSNPPLDNAQTICQHLTTLSHQLDELRKECQQRYPSLKDVAERNPNNTIPHLAELEKFSKVGKLLDIHWGESSYKESTEPPLVGSINLAIASLRGQTR